MQKKLILLSIIVSACLVSCSGSQAPLTTQSNSDTSEEGYTTAFPSRNISSSLQEIQKSIVRIISTSYYDTYTFNRPIVKMADIKSNKLGDISSQQFSSEESTAGTSIILNIKANGDALLLSSAHAVTSPDTLVSYFPKEQAVENTFIKSISIKRRQSNLIFSPNNLSSFRVIADRQVSDLALLSAKLKSELQNQHRARPIGLGKTEHIQLGSFLYILGFPKGFPMITRGLASTRGLRPHRFFITDALFNPGISGGLVIASKDNFNSFEWVGVARSATADKETVLVPHPDREDFSRGTLEPYGDAIFVDRKNRISYGITQAVPIDEVRSFIKESQGVIRRYDHYYSVR